MKKQISIFLVLAMCFALLAGCGSTTETANSSGTDGKTAGINGTGNREWRIAKASEDLYSLITELLSFIKIENSMSIDLNADINCSIEEILETSGNI